MSTNANTNITGYVVCGSKNGHYFGFKQVNGSWYGVCSQTGTGAETITGILLAAAASTLYMLEARFTPNLGIDFLINGTKYGSITTTSNIPNAATFIQMMSIDVTTQETAVKSYFVSVFDFLQALNITQ